MTAKKYNSREEFDKDVDKIFDELLKVVMNDGVTSGLAMDAALKLVAEVLLRIADNEDEFVTFINGIIPAVLRHCNSISAEDQTKAFLEKVMSET